MSTDPADHGVEWQSGSLDELVAMLAEPSLTTRIEVIVSDGGKERTAGEVHLVAGGVGEVSHGELRGEAAREAIRRLSPPFRFRVAPRLPDPTTGALVPPGPSEGILAQRPLAKLMRYCEDYVLTCVLEVWRSGDHVSIRYRRGEIASTAVNGSDAPERLPEVMTWTEGNYRIVLPPLVLPKPITTPPPHSFSAPVEDAARRATTSPLFPATSPAAHSSGTSPGRPVDVYGPPAPMRTTDLGVPAPTAPPLTHASSPARPTSATHPLPGRTATPFPITPSMTPASASLAAASPVPRPSPGSTTPAFPRTGSRRPMRRSARRIRHKRSIYDLPLLAHVAIGLALGLSVVVVFWVIKKFIAP